MNHFLRLTCLFVLITAWTWSAETTGQWLKAELAVIDVTVTTDKGEQTYFYLNSRGDATVRLGDKEKKGAIKIAKDKSVIPFVDYIYQLPNEKASETKNSAHIQRRIGDQIERFIVYYKSAEDAKTLLTHIDAVAKNIK
jgi:hypothetical protein